MLGTLPVDAQALEHQADGFAAELAWRPSLLVADLGEQGQRPKTGFLALGTGGLLEQGSQVWVAVSGPGGAEGVGCLGLGVQAWQSLGGEGPQGIANGLGGTAQGEGNLRRALSLVALQQDLAATQGKGIGRAESLTQSRPLGFGQWPNKERWLHTSFYAPDASCTGSILRLH
jgi:hypothetical protein